MSWSSGHEVPSAAMIFPDLVILCTEDASHRLLAHSPVAVRMCICLRGLSADCTAGSVCCAANALIVSGIPREGITMRLNVSSSPFLLSFNQLLPEQFAACSAGVWNIIACVWSD